MKPGAFKEQWIMIRSFGGQYPFALKMSLQELAVNLEFLQNFVEQFLAKISKICPEAHLQWGFGPMFGVTS
jgi:hypothetical protein